MRCILVPIRPLLCDIITVSLRLSQFFSTKCIDYNTSCVGAVAKSNPMGTNTYRIANNTLRRETLTKSYSNIESVIEKHQPNVIHI